MEVRVFHGSSGAKFVLIKMKMVLNQRTRSFIEKAIDDMGLAFSHSFIKKVSNGDSTLFWKDSWDDSFIPHHTWIPWVPIKVNLFIWKAAIDRLPTFSNLAIRGIALASTLCPICKMEEETIIWKWRNRYVHASVDQQPNVLAEDLFLQLQRYSLLLIANRSSMASNDWPTWISNPITSLATAIEVVIVLLNEDWSLSFSLRLRSVLNLLELWWNKSENYLDSICGELKEELEEEMKVELKEEMKNKLKEEMREELKEEMCEELKEEMRAEI
ncbi:reverse transcriptase zinc-binding domain-containing protein [Artemisia annua]|uniref:Reverse transcriptase zinc-binding domain-containing protein n=1 Tax=Artemisia annua TaxID=35608 RepID=A0A2U1ME46_ARTAN|nr:reverse transcriptase zinc-binding domain-containing protein [Artemisia annua]